MVTRPIRLRLPLGCLFQSVLREQFVRNEPSVLYRVNLSAQLSFNDDSRKSSPTLMHHPSAPSWRVERSLPIRLPWAIPLHWTPSLLTTPRQSGWSHCGWLRHVSRDVLTHTQGTTYFQPSRWDVYSDNPNSIRWWRLRPRSVVWQNGQQRTGCSGATCNQRQWQCTSIERWNKRRGLAARCCRDSMLKRCAMCAHPTHHHPPKLYINRSPYAEDTYPVFTLRFPKVVEFISYKKGQIRQINQLPHSKSCIITSTRNYVPRSSRLATLTSKCWKNATKSSLK